jgi:hypothetical protein
MLSAFCVLAGMCLVWSTQVEKHFGASCHGLGWSAQVEMHFVSSRTLDEAGQHVGICTSWLAWEEFDQHMLRCIFCWRGLGLVNIIYMHFVCSLAWVGFDQHMVRCILSTRWRRMGFFNAC